MSDAITSAFNDGYIAEQYESKINEPERKAKFLRTRFMGLFRNVADALRQKQKGKTIKRPFGSYCFKASREKLEIIDEAAAIENLRNIGKTYAMRVTVDFDDMEPQRAKAILQEIERANQDAVKYEILVGRLKGDDRELLGTKGFKWRKPGAEETFSVE